ncbi:hypothetical protein B0H13DRAFT_1876051 [Mycena leptocephala]|nr:hypothetical protein B0H13DRAFT_1876051 [Mycena leptocephala]
MGGHGGMLRVVGAIGGHFDALFARWLACWNEGWWWEGEKRRGAVKKSRVSFPRIIGAKPGTFPKWNAPPLCSRAAHSLNVPPYGPFAGYFHEKFPPTFFLIKPQAYLSSVSNQPPGTEVDGSRTYSDLTVCQFFGADADATAPVLIL